MSEQEKSTDVTSNINNGYILLKCAIGALALHADLLAHIKLLLMLLVTPVSFLFISSQNALCDVLDLQRGDHAVQSLRLTG